MGAYPRTTHASGPSSVSHERYEGLFGDQYAGLAVSLSTFEITREHVELPFIDRGGRVR